MKIFISIASYQDPLLKATINSAYNNAENPENLIFGICDQSNEPLDTKSFSFSDQIKSLIQHILLDLLNIRLRLTLFSLALLT